MYSVCDRAKTEPGSLTPISTLLLGGVCRLLTRHACSHVHGLDGLAEVTSSSKHPSILRCIQPPNVALLSFEDENTNSLGLVIWTVCEDYLIRVRFHFQ